MPSPAPFGPGPTEPVSPSSSRVGRNELITCQVRRADYHSGSRYARAEFSPGYGMRGAVSLASLAATIKREES